MKSSSVIRHRVKGMPAQDGAGVKLSRVINQPAFRHKDPFLMLDEFKSDDPNDYIAGFPPHPHRGFCTLSYMLAGKMAHEDSTGNSGEIGPGGLQWMKAARGIIHSEMPKQENGLMWGFQLWLNLPASEKLSDPEYADIPGDKVPEVKIENGLVRVLSGNFENEEGPVKAPGRSFLYLDYRTQADSEIELPNQGQSTRLLYVYEGGILLDGINVGAGELVELDDEATVTLKTKGETGFLLLAAQPIGEPIAQYGPFVMNTENELRQAFTDYQNGTLAQ
ncbi:MULTISPECIES: pirin family protein [Gammaproteobacteria]|uniref:pirin family protein n=1 Tax=Gammaproteobacteria TaxID=1236 RepID=UPI000DD0C8F8|nr:MULTISPECIES: pirin family protein [Gammaproteobacteria]RTE87008.1 pirin family protein [Aliidiomarina sp. B3213]TCZ93202.1 pirin family protein [Lysobacter sp. N42]